MQQISSISGEHSTKEFGMIYLACERKNPLVSDWGEEKERKNNFCDVGNNYGDPLKPVRKLVEVPSSWSWYTLKNKASAIESS